MWPSNLRPAEGSTVVGDGTHGEGPVTLNRGTRARESTACAQSIFCLAAFPCRPEFPTDTDTAYTTQMELGRRRCAMGVSEALPCHPNRGTKTTSVVAGAGIAQLPRHSPCLHFTEHILYVLGLAGVPAYAAWCMLHTFTVDAGLTLSTSRSNLHSILATSLKTWSVSCKRCTMIVCLPRPPCLTVVLRS